MATKIINVEMEMVKPAYTLSQLVQYFFKLGYSGFGGPVALVGYMHRDLVEECKWITEDEYKDGLALAQLAPGPLAAQLGIYLGFVHYRILGATLCGVAFVLPSFFMVVIIGIAYKMFGGLPWMQAIFYGVGAAVVGIISISSYRLTEKSISKFNFQSITSKMDALAILFNSSDNNHNHATGTSIIVYCCRVITHVRKSATEMA